MNHVGKAQQAKPPEKGAFPLDRDHACDEGKNNFLACLKNTRGDHSSCREFSLAYLSCRQKKSLMDGTPLSKLGFTKEADEKAKIASKNNLDGSKNRGEFVSGMHITERPRPATSRRGPGH